MLQKGKRKQSDELFRFEYEKEGPMTFSTFKSFRCGKAIRMGNVNSSKSNSSNGDLLGRYYISFVDWVQRLDLRGKEGKNGDLHGDVMY